MNIVGQIRRLRCLPRLLLAVVVLTVAQTSLVPCAMAFASAPMTEMGEHCVYCPPGMSAVSAATDCVFPDTPTVDVYAASAQHMSVMFDSPLLQPATFGLSELRQVQTIYPALEPVIAPTRPLNLTHCVQLK